MALIPIDCSCRHFFSRAGLSHVQMLPYGRRAPCPTRLSCRASLCVTLLCAFIFFPPLLVACLLFFLFGDESYMMGSPRRFPEIGRLRKKAQSLRQGIKSTMDRLMAGGEFAGMLAVSLYIYSLLIRTCFFLQQQFFIFIFPFFRVLIALGRFYRINTAAVLCLRQCRGGCMEQRLSLFPPTTLRVLHLCRAAGPALVRVPSANPAFAEDSYSTVAVRG